MCKVTHAYVCFTDDDETKIVKLSDIKAFNPEGVDGYDMTKKYKVKWHNERTRKSSYYNAAILLLGSKYV